MPVVLIVGGNNRTVQFLINTLLSHPDCPTLRVLVHTRSGLERLSNVFPALAQLPHGIIMGHFNDQENSVSVCRGVTTVVYTGNAIRRQEAAVAINAIDAAKVAGVQHFVFCSVLHPMMTKLITHGLKLEVEEHLIESKLNYTILQPSHFMQNLSLDHVMRTGKLQLGYSHSIVQGSLDLRDFSNVLRKIILDPMRHNMASYELVSQNISYTEVAELLEELMHRHIECEVIPVKTYISILKEGPVVQSEYSEDTIERMMVYLNRWGLTGNSNVLQWLLGREPTTWRQYATEMLREPGSVDPKAMNLT